jgi:hypothetical protein
MAARNTQCATPVSLALFKPLGITGTAFCERKPHGEKVPHRARVKRGGGGEGFPPIWAEIVWGVPGQEPYTKDIGGDRGSSPGLEHIDPRNDFAV